jgi:hypothetical protein
VLLKQEVQNKAQLVLQKEQEIESLNGTFTTTISTKEEEIIAKSQLLSQTTSKLKKVSRKLAQEVQSKNQLALQKEQEIESLRELLALKESELQEKEELLTQKDLVIVQKDELLLAKDVEKEELVRQQETEKQELLALKESELQEKEELLAQKNLELQNMDQLILQREAESQEKDNLLAQKDLVIVQKDELLLAKDIEKEELMRQQEREREELLAQRDRELQELEKVNNDVLIEEFIEILPQRYPDLYPNNFAEWPHDIWGKQVVDGNDIGSIKHYLPIYRKEVVENLTQLILAEKTKVEELLVEKANEQQRLIDKDNLLSDQTANIERINLLLETKEIIIQRLEQEKTILQTRHDILDMKMQLTVKEFTVREREKDKALVEKDNELKKLAESNKLLADYQEEMLKFRELCAIKDAEIREKDELLNQKELEKQELLVQKEMEKTVLVDDLQEKLHLKDSEILGLQMMVSEMNLAGEYHIVELND